MSIPKFTYLTPGPSALYFTLENHLKTALKEQVPSISHRGNGFQRIFQEAAQNLRDLFALPHNYHVLFTSSANEIWERLLENCVKEESFHLVNGAFSRKFFSFAQSLGKNALHAAAAPGSCVDIEQLMIPESAEMIAFTHNETSTGAAQPLEDIYTIRKAFPEALISVDIVSSAPYVDLDFNQVDSAYFSVQKCFGLPAGLGVWLVNDKCLEKAEKMQKNGHSIGTYHTLPKLVDAATKYQTPETPNMLGIYLLGKVAGDMLTKGLEQIRRETDYKAALLYHALESHAHFQPFVNKSAYRSQTVIVAETPIESSEVITALQAKGLIVGSGYGEFKRHHFRVANFPTHSKETIEMLVDYLAEL